MAKRTEITTAKEKSNVGNQKQKQMIKVIHYLKSKNEKDLFEEKKYLIQHYHNVSFCPFCLYYSLDSSHLFCHLNTHINYLKKFDKTYNIKQYKTFLIYTYNTHIQKKTKEQQLVFNDNLFYHILFKVLDKKGLLNRDFRRSLIDLVEPTKKNIRDIVTTITEYDVNREIKKSFKTDYEIENDKQENYSKFKQSFINKLKVLETINDTYYNHFKQKTNEMFFPLQEELNKLDEENNQLSKEIKRYQQELENKNMIIFTRDRTIRTLEIQNKALSEELEKQKWNSNYYQKLSNIRLQQLEEHRKINKTIINN